MKYISVFSGIEAASVAWSNLGWEPVAFSEIEPFPCRVLQHHYPSVPNLGDITKIDWRPYVGAVDLVVGGSPCQSFSIAGRREGMDGASGLVREYFRCLEIVRPSFFLWENVPGALSSSRGNDFQFILRQWDKLGYHVAWRVLDAEFFGVAQRRRRLFAFGSLRDWRDPIKVLFERESLRGDSAKGEKKAKEIARCLTSRAERYDSETENFICGTLNASAAGTSRPAGQGNELDFCIPQGTAVRRLTPKECERLQGFPDGWTDIQFRGKPASDSLRYKAIGNSMAVPVMRWIGERIEQLTKGD